NLILAIMSFSVFFQGGTVCISCWIMAFQLAFLLLRGICRVTDVVFSTHSFLMSEDNGIKYVFW
ncbi:hypothetical protein glysoja_006355, partial [Glycine soja]